MTDPAIRAALEAACMANCMLRARFNECQDEPCARICGWCRKGATAAIAAFHRKRAVDYRSVGLIPSAIAHDDLARAVEQAAKEGER
jgi:hypothetical protein